MSLIKEKKKKKKKNTALREEKTTPNMSWSVINPPWIIYF